MGYPGPFGPVRAGTTGSSLIVVTSAVSTQAPGVAQWLTISALNTVDGNPRWQQTLAHQELSSAIRAADGAVYLLGGQSSATDISHVLTAVSAASGSLLWHQTQGTGSILGMVAGDGAVYVGRYPAHVVAAGHARRQMRSSILHSVCSPRPR